MKSIVGAAPITADGEKDSAAITIIWVGGNNQ